MGLSTAEATPTPSPRVLLVDRDIDTIRMYAEHLTRASFRVDEAIDGREALAKAVSQAPAAVVTETRLPGIDGYELIELLRRDKATMSTPVIVVTGDAYAEDVQRARTAGADLVLVKPCMPDRLLLGLREAIARSAELRAWSRQLIATAAEQRIRSERMTEQGGQRARRMASSRVFERHATRMPPAQPPHLPCPVCARRLTYMQSFVGGVSPRFPEQWDEFHCAAGCGSFQYRQRTRKLRKVG